MKSFLLQHKHFFALLLLVPDLIWFKSLEILLIPRYTIALPLDYRIPFLKIFVIPYLLWFPYIAYGLIYTGLRNKKDFYKLLIFLGGGMAVAYTAYMIFPNAQTLRPVITQSDPLSLLVKFIYATDTPTNVCPSVHVINAIAVDAALRNSADFGAKRYRKTVSSALTILICLSTMFIKQHSAADVFCGLAVSAVFYACLYSVPKINQAVCRRRLHGRYYAERGEKYGAHDLYR